ncbi:VIT1/CCC1 transporter family protein [Sphingobium phenoxybenzoativorans]|nr:VIT family protein [Sphingobium phenoxybenzoativorans]
MIHSERHSINRIGWLRAAVLGANDGIVSTASLIIGVAAAGTARENILLSGIAALVAGAMSMAAGEYVSVSSQSDTERADLKKERRELADEPELELQELTAIYMGRGLSSDLARQVAEQLTAQDALAAHARDELGISPELAARPLQAAAASALTFSAGAAAPLLAVAAVPVDLLLYVVPVVALLGLILLGYLGAWAGGAKATRPVLRVAFWGVLAMAITAGIGRLVGTVV